MLYMHIFNLDVYSILGVDVMKTGDKGMTDMYLLELDRYLCEACGRVRWGLTDHVEVVCRLTFYF